MCAKFYLCRLRFGSTRAKNLFLSKNGARSSQLGANVTFSRTIQIWRLLHTTSSACLCFYGATLCVSAVFAVARCPSVPPSVTLVHCIQTAEDIVKFLSRPDSPIILVFLPPSAGTQFQGNPFSMGAKYTGVGKFCDFRVKSPFLRKRYEAHGCYGTLIGGGSICVGSDDPEWPLTRVSRSLYSYK